MSRSRIVSLALCALVFSLPATGQTISGRVTDDLTELPVPGATLTIIRQSDRAVVQAMTDLQGRFVMNAPGDGLYRVYASRIAYDHLGGGPFELASGDTLNLDLFMTRTVLEMDEVMVEEARLLPHLEREGFYQRLRQGWGEFITRDQIERRDAFSPTDLLWGVRGVRLIPDQHGVIIANGRKGVALSPYACGGRMTVFLDGMMVGYGTLDGFVSVDAIEAIEVYPSPMGMPQQFASRSPCGAVVVWTRR
jgi:hypothetical protein